MESKDIELGEEQITVETRPRSGVVISVRLSPREADQLQAIAEQRQTTFSQIVREAVGSYLEHTGALIDYRWHLAREPEYVVWPLSTKGNANLESLTVHPLPMADSLAGPTRSG